MYPTSPIPDPPTVTLIDPDAPPFTRTTALTPPPPPERPSVTLPPPPPPTVTSAPRLPTPDCPHRHCSAVSDTHSLLSQPLPPSLPRPVADASPIPPPCTVKLADPLLPPLPRLPTDSDGAPALVASVTLPTLDPTLTDSPRLLDHPPALRQATAVSDTHSDPSLPLSPIRPDCIVHDTSPYPAPTTVMLADPLDPAFSRPPTLARPKSLDTTAVTDPLATPVVKDTRSVPADPEPVRHRTAVSDSHHVPSLSVPRTRAPLEAPSSPS